MKFLFFVTAVLTTALTFGQDFSDLNAPIPVNKELTIGQLENGMTYYIRKNEKPANKVELRLVVNAGSNLETDAQQGLAHFMEHMNFNGTKNFEHNELVDYLQSIGVKFGQHLNAYTSFDETVYILPIPSDDPEKLEKGFDILEDWAFNNLLTPEEIDKERGVVLEELRLGLGANKRMLDRYLPLVMYQSRYAERLPIGKKDILENFDHKELKDFYKSWYRPNLMAVMVVGDIDVVEMEEKIKKHFSPYKNPANEKERKEFEVPDHDETFVAIETDPEASFTQVQLMYNDKGLPKTYKTVGDYRRYVMEGLFATMINERLAEIGNNPNPPFNYGYSYHGAGWSRNKTAYQSYSMSDPANQLRAFETLVVENERVRRHGFLQSELDRAKKMSLSNLEASLKEKDKTPSGRLVGELIRNFLEDEFIPGIEWEYKASKALMEGIELKEVNELINEFIHDDNRMVVFTGPEGEGIPKYTKKEVMAILDDVKNREIEAYKEEEVASSLLEDKPELGEIKSKEVVGDLEFTKLLLSNGVTVYYKKTDFSDNQVLMRAYSPGGTSLIQSAEDFKKINLAIDGLTEAGMNGFSLNDMSKIQAGKEVSVSPYITDSYEGMWGSTVNKDVEEMFQMIYLYFTALNKDKEAYDAFVTKQTAFLGNLMNTPQYWFMNEQAKVYDKNNPRRMNMIPTVEEFAMQDYDKAYEFYQQRFSNASDFTFLFVGSLDDEEIQTFAMRYLATLPALGGEKEKPVPHVYEHLKGKQEFVFKRGQDPKSTVEITFRTEADFDPQQAYFLKCASEILTIKLVENLREGESGVYGVGASSYANHYPTGSYSFSISFPCGPENVDKLKKAALEELDKLIKNGPQKKELDKIKEAQKLELRENMKKNEYWIRELFRMLERGEDISKFGGKAEKIEAVTADQIHEAIKKYISKDRIVWVLMPEE